MFIVWLLFTGVVFSSISYRWRSQVVLQLLIWQWCWQIELMKVSLVKHHLFNYHVSSMLWGERIYTILKLMMWTVNLFQCEVPKSAAHKRAPLQTSMWVPILNKTLPWHQPQAQVSPRSPLIPVHLQLFHCQLQLLVLRLVYSHVQPPMNPNMVNMVILPVSQHHLYLLIQPGIHEEGDPFVLRLRNYWRVEDGEVAAAEVCAWEGSEVDIGGTVVGGLEGRRNSCSRQRLGYTGRWWISRPLQPHPPQAPFNLSALIISRLSIWNSTSASINCVRTLESLSSAYFSSSIPSVIIIASMLLWRRMYPHDAPSALQQVLPSHRLYLFGRINTSIGKGIEGKDGAHGSVYREIGNWESLMNGTCHKRRGLPLHVSRYILYREYQGDVLCLVESGKGWIDWEIERGS